MQVILIMAKVMAAKEQFWAVLIQTCFAMDIQPVLLEQGVVNLES